MFFRVPLVLLTAFGMAALLQTMNGIGVKCVADRWTCLVCNATDSRRWCYCNTIGKQQQVADALPMNMWPCKASRYA